MPPVSNLTEVSGDRYERSTYSSSRSPSPRPRRRKSLGEEALGAIGGALGIKAARDRSRSRSRDRDRYSDRGRSRKYRSYSDSRSRSRGRRAKSEARIAQAMKAALAAGAAEAFRVRSTPGPWTGEKGRRVLTAAVSAGGVDGLIDRDPNKHGGRHVLESILAGLATNRLVNGARSNSRPRNGSRGRSQSRGGIRDMAAAGILAAAGKQAYDRFSKSRGRDRSDSPDSRDGGRDSKKRGSSVSRAINKGLAALGLDDKNQSDRGRDRSARSSDYSDSEDDHSYRSSRRRRSSRDVRSQGSNSVSGSRAVAQRDGSSNGKIECHSDCDSDSDLDSDDEKREKKKMFRKELVTSGLATVATIHAAHNVIKNLEAQKKRHDAVKSGAISKEQERTMQRKADLKNVASIGLAALGIKGAIGEWKEVQEQRKEHKEFENKCKERHERRMRRAQSAAGSNRYSQGNRSRAASAASMGMNPGQDYGHDYGHHASHYYDGNPYGDMSIDV